MFARELAVSGVDRGCWGLMDLPPAVPADRRNKGGKPPVPVDKTAQQATASGIESQTLIFGRVSARSAPRLWRVAVPRMVEILRESWRETAGRPQTRSGSWITGFRRVTLCRKWVALCQKWVALCRLWSLDFPFFSRVLVDLPTHARKLGQRLAYYLAASLDGVGVAGLVGPNIFAKRLHPNAP